MTVDEVLKYKIDFVRGERRYDMPSGNVYISQVRRGMRLVWQQGADRIEAKFKSEREVAQYIAEREG